MTPAQPQGHAGHRQRVSAPFRHRSRPPQPVRCRPAPQPPSDSQAARRRCANSRPAAHMPPPQLKSISCHKDSTIHPYYHTQNHSTPMAPPLFRLPAIELPDAFIRAPAVGPQPFLLPWLHDVVSQVDVFTQLLHHVVDSVFPVIIRKPRCCQPDGSASIHPTRRLPCARLCLLRTTPYTDA